MSHIHIPDGILPLWLVALGWVIIVGWIALATKMASAEELRRRVPLVGAMAALMLVGMTTEIIPIAYHVNLTVLAGILLGPWLSVITALVVNVMLALVGHGGTTVIGLNSVVIALEMVVGWALFGQLVRLLGRRRAGMSAAIATVLALALSTTLLVAIVAAGGAPATGRESGAFDPTTLSFHNPFGGGVVANVIATKEQPAAVPVLSVTRFATMVYALGSIGWLLEALIIAQIVGFIARVRPGLVFEGAPAQPVRAPLGDEGVHH
jgi:cobalt/nickel transport system permease protein